MTGRKIRIYDLARELRLESQRVIEDVRREGLDVSVPSNTIPMEIAERIRAKYFPKKSAPAVKGRLIKTQKPEQAPEAASEQEAPPAEAVVEPAVTKPPLEPAKRPEPSTKIRKLKAVSIPQPEAQTPAPEQTPQPPRPKTQVRILRPQPGISAAPTTTQTTSVEATQAESPAPPPHKPRTTYIPEDSGRPRKRSRRSKRAIATEVSREEDKTQPLRHVHGPFAAAAQPKPKPIPTELKPIKLVEGITVREFSDRLEVKPKDLIQMLLQRKIAASINQTLDPEVAREIGRELGYEITFVPFEQMISETEEEKITESGQENLVRRAPVVTVMGHVDHGKTSLLDAIRKTRIAEGEAGGITQHIGAYSVQVPDPDDPNQKRRIVFLDTPGHEAFTMMRARGAKVTDIVVLVVAADDGVMPQTIEAIDHARAAEVPIIVAINKIDKPEAQPDRVRQQLADYGLVWEKWGGSTVMVEVSAKKQINLDLLLEMIILTADLLDLKANPDRMASGVVLEAKLDRGRGPVATVLVQQGTLKIGDAFIVGQVYGRVRALFDDQGRSLQQAGPSTPVEVLGLQGVPQAGDHFQVVEDLEQAQRIANQRQMQARQAAIARTAARGLEQLLASRDQIKELLVILKADVQGSVEAVREVLNKLSTDKVKIRIIRSGVGAITESDVMLAAAAAKDMNRAAVIIGFNVRPDARAREVAESENVDMRLHTVIYKIEEEIRNAMMGLLEAKKREVITGHAEVRQTFRIPKVGIVAGCYVTDGAIRRTQARVLRDNVVVYDGRIESLKRFKEDVSEVKQGFECGIALERFQDIKVGDVIETYTVEEVAQTSL
jgi:translation initiation factor IF-2